MHSARDTSTAMSCVVCMRGQTLTWEDSCTQSHHSVYAPRSVASLAPAMNMPHSLNAIDSSQAELIRELVMSLAGRTAEAMSVQDFFNLV